MSTRPNKFTTERRDSDALVVKNKQPKGAKSLTLTSVAIAREESRHSDMRVEDRNSLRESVQIRFRGRDWDAILINLSSGGAMIEIGLSPNIAESIVLTLGAETPECAVRWVKAKRVGLEFSSEFQAKSKWQNRKRRRQALTSFNESSARNNFFAPKSACETNSGVPLFLNQSGEPIEGSHRWTACLRSIGASELLAKSRGKFRLSSEAMRDLSSSGMIRATISWSTGKRVARMH